MTPRVPAWLVMILAIVQFLAPAFHWATGIGHEIAGQGSPGIGPSPEMPAGYAFSIWFVIFTLSLIYSMVQILSDEKHKPFYQQLKPWAAVTFTLSTVWMLLAQAFGNGWWLVATIVLLALSALKAFCVVQQYCPLANVAKKWVVMPLFAMYSGWLTLAVFLNISSVLKPWAFEFFAPTPNQYALATVLLAIMAAVGVIVKSGGNRWYAGTIVWGLAAVWVTNTTILNNPIFANLTVALAIGVAILAAWARKRAAGLCFQEPTSHTQADTSLQRLEEQ